MLPEAECCLTAETLVIFLLWDHNIIDSVILLDPQSPKDGAVIFTSRSASRRGIILIIQRGHIHSALRVLVACNCLESESRQLPAARLVVAWREQCETVNLEWFLNGWNPWIWRWFG